MMAGGARTILLTRWRTGGRTNLELVREFTQELSQSPAAEAWGRALSAPHEAPLDAENEPRLRGLEQEGELATANHPFFWAGYLGGVLRVGLHAAHERGQRFASCLFRCFLVDTELSSELVHGDLRQEIVKTGHRCSPLSVRNTVDCDRSLWPFRCSLICRGAVNYAGSASARAGSAVVAGTGWLGPLRRNSSAATSAPKVKKPADHQKAVV